MALLHLARRLAPAMVQAGKGAIIVTGNYGEYGALEGVERTTSSIILSTKFER